MHPESKLTSHGKASSNGGQSQPANVSQGPKGTGLLGPKPNHMSPSGVGLKTAQNQGPNHGNGQRESSGEVAEQKEPGTPSLDPEPKGEIPPRSKRRCVQERKHPYSGDEWCSGPDSEEDEKNLVIPHICSVSDSAVSAPTVPGSGSASLPGLNDSSSSSTAHGASQSLHGEGGGPGGSSKAASRYVYVFTTYLANTAAEAVLQGRADSVLHYHQQNVPRAKLDEDALQKPPSTPNTAGEDSVPTLPPSTSPAPASHPTNTPIQAPPNVLPTEAVVEETKQELTPNTGGNSNSRPASSHSNPPPPPSAPLPVEDPGLLESTQETMTLNTEVLSREQLEHRERSLQTLRDIERLLLRSGADSESFSRHSTSPVEGSVPSHPQPHVPSNPPTPIKKYEEPLQSMITQTQSLGGPGMEQEMGGPPTGPDMGHQMSLMMQRLGQDSLTPEQAAWRKLQEEYYAEKRRKEEHMTVHGRSAPELMLRGPPPPYHNKPGEQWVGNRLPVTLEGQEAMQVRGGGITFQGPRFPGRYALMQNMPMDTIGVMQRPGRWPEDMASVGGVQGSFPQSGMAFPGGGQGEVERFLNPPSRDEFLRHQLLEKRSPVMQRQLSIPSGQGIDMDRVIMQQRQGDPSMFQGDGLGSGSTMGMDFGGSRNMVSPPMGRPGPVRELESAGGGGNLNMNMSVNMNMNLNLQMTPHQQMLLSQKMRNDLIGSQAGVGSEELVRTTRVQNGSGGQKMVIQDGAPTQNPLSLMMSQMSKYAMPSSTPLYHNAIKTIATCDDDLLPDRVLLPPGCQQGPGMNPPISLHLNLSSSQSPVGNIGLQGQPPLSHEPPTSMLNSPGPPMHPSIGPIQTPLMIPSVNQDSCCPGSQMMSSNSLVFPPRLQPGPPHNPPLPQGAGNNSMQQNYPDEAPNQPCLPHRISEAYGHGLPSVLTDPELGEVIRPSPSGIPEFDLSRIMPSEKPSSTLQYFPKGSTQPLKSHPANMHLLGLQNMMVEQHSGRSGPSLPGPQRTLGMPPMHPMGRTGMAPPSQTAQQNFMLMKQRSVSGEMYPQSSSMLSPQGALGGHLHGQQSMMVGHQMRQRSVSLDTYIPGPGHLPF
ncbi:B-cell CLL/lymphoma 9-like protein [Bufo gargarizans]|uniref:B-cell CLL/lymphoma 9-like protein n=1 Tax=Bufo gargarizans TaxID=30331 RepID=UPI001CF5018A|nr:B-cell CLL/lymphoma 9-like protein [Bufo gargarizans]